MFSKTPPLFRHKVDYGGANDEKNCCSDDSRTETDDFVRKLYKEHHNEKNEEFKGDTSVINITNESKIGKYKKKKHLLTVC